MNFLSVCEKSTIRQHAPSEILSSEHWFSFTESCCDPARLSERRARRIAGSGPRGRWRRVRTIRDVAAYFCGCARRVPFVADCSAKLAARRKRPPARMKTNSAEDSMAPSSSAMTGIIGRTLKQTRQDRPRIERPGQLSVWWYGGKQRTWEGRTLCGTC